MKHLILIIVLLMVVLLFGCATSGYDIAEEIKIKEKEHPKVIKIYERNSIAPKYIIKETSKEVYKVYKPNCIAPIFEIRRNKIYRPGKLLPEKEIKIE